jgi:peroxiredoxin
VGELGQLQDEIESFRKAGIGLLALSVDPPDKLLKTSEKIGAEFRFVSDSKGELLDRFGLRHEGGNPFTGADIARPAQLLISREGVMLWSHYADNYRVRLTPAEVLTAAEKAVVQ